MISSDFSSKYTQPSATKGDSRIAITMEPLTLKHRQPTEDIMENWDDDADFQGLGDLNFRNVSSTTSASTQPHRRDSVSSRMSTRSDRESLTGGDEDWHVLLPTDDEKSTADAINSAKSAGIPIPQNVPASALMGGTIKRLGGKKLKKVLGDDWGDDIEMPKAHEGALKLKTSKAADFPDALRGFSAEFPTSPSPSKPQSNMSFMDRLASATKARTGAATLDKFKDDDDEDDFFGDVPTIKVAKSRSPQKPVPFAAPFPNPQKQADDIEDGLELPDDGEPLRLSLRKEPPRTPASNFIDDSDMDWAESSLGTRFGGTRRDMRSNPSSSISAFSPSASSCLTAESEDDGLDGLILPDSNFKFGEALKKRVESVSPDFSAMKLSPFASNIKPPNLEDESRRAETRPEISAKPQLPPPSSSFITEDFFTGIDIGDGDIFDSSKLTLNRNIKHTKMQRHYSPLKRTGTSLTFTNKVDAGPSRIPRPQSHDRPRSTLEPVSESGPAPQYQRPASRLGHSAHSSTSSIPTPSTPSSSSKVTAPSTPSRRGLNSKSSQDVLRPQNTTHPANYLKAKRSMPVITRQHPSPARQPAYQRPSSRAGEASSHSGNRSTLTSRPKTPVDRSGAESSLSNIRKSSKPFLPAGTPSAQSHHVNVKSSRHFNRPTSSDSNDNGLTSRPLSRLSHSHRPTTPTNGRLAPESLTREAASKRTLTKPTRRRVFGDGNELDTFDDLPTSASNESKFMKQPVARGAPKSVQMRSKLGLQSANAPSTTTNKPAVSASATSNRPSPPLRMAIPGSPPKPFIARDTEASRIAREQRVAATNTATNPPSPRQPVTTRSSPPLRLTVPGSPTRPIPHFARETNASRHAREQRMNSVSATLHGAPSLPTVRESAGHPSILNTTSAARMDALSERLATPKRYSRRRPKAPAQKPHLIKPIGDVHSHAKEHNGMKWNPSLYSWQGNEDEFDQLEWNTDTHSQAPFADGPPPLAAGISAPQRSPGSPANATKVTPALICNPSGASKAAHIVGGMVFDPEQMCWLATRKDSQDDDEDDPFAGIEDLVETQFKAAKPSFRSVSSSSWNTEKALAELRACDDDLPVVAESFDVGPAFVARCRAEDAKCVQKVSSWLFGVERGAVERNGKWEIRGKCRISESGDL